MITWKEAWERSDDIEKMAGLGYLDKEIAKNIGVSRQTFCTWKKDHPELADLLKKARRNPVLDVKAALFKRATGYDYEETTTDIFSDGTVKTRIVKKHLPADPASMMILLKHWAKDEGWTNDPAALDVRKKELALKEKQAEKEDW